MKVLMRPHLHELPNHSSGIAQVIVNYFRYLPDFGVELVDQDAESYDLAVGHAAAWPEADVHHSHGLLWTSEFDLGDYSWDVNASIVKAARNAREIIVPSQWVAQPFRRDMRRSVHVIGHGVNWEEWQHDYEIGSYVLWAKNRVSDGLSPEAVYELAEAFPSVDFITTFGESRTDNIKVLDRMLPHDEMKKLIQGALVFLASDRETWGIAIAEAMAAGVPVLSVNSGAVPGFMPHGLAGYCFKPGSTEDAIQGLSYCIENRLTLSDNGKYLASKMGWREMCEKVAGVYRLATQGSRPTVSIVIPCYNYAAELDEAIASAVNQSYPGLEEIIVVDDGSTDDAVRTVTENWRTKDSRVQWVRIPNSGVAEARNRGILLARSKYICPLDADDRIEPGFIARLVPALEGDRSLGVAYTGVRVVFVGGKHDGQETVPWDWREAIRPGEVMRGRRWPREWNYEAQVEGENQIPTCCLIRRRALLDMGGYRSRYCPGGAGSEDAELFLRLGAAGWGAQYVPPARDCLFVHSHGEGYVSGRRGYREPDWRAWHPWTKDYLHPFASRAIPIDVRPSHPVRSYEQPLVSVVIPVGPGHERAVIEALDSVEAQTFRDWEVIVAWDTGAGTSAIARSHPHVKIINTHGHGSGAGVARNLAVKSAKAPFLAFLDADDYYSPTFLEKCWKAWKHKRSIIYTEFVSKMTREQREKYGGRIVDKDDYEGWIVTDYQFKLFDRGRAMQRPEGDRPYVWSGVNIFLPREVHDDIGGFDESMGTWEDCDYLLRLAWYGYDFYRVPEPLWLYNFSTGRRRDLSEDRREELIVYLQKKYDKIVTGE